MTENSSIFQASDNVFFSFFLHSASELNHKMAADVSQAIRLSLSACMCVFVCLSDVEIRCVPHSSPPFWNSDGRWEEGGEEGEGGEAAVQWPSLLCVCFGAGG